jgi:ribosomal protein L22
MEIQALTRNARMSPRKVREIANQIQGRPVPEAIDFLTLIPRKSARLLAKTLKSAVANAENNNSLAASALTVHRASSACRTSASSSPTANPTNFYHGTKDQPHRLPPRSSP